MKKLLCAVVTGKICYVTVKEIKPGLYARTGKKEVIPDDDFIACMIEKLKYENNEITFKTESKEYTIKLEEKIAKQEE